MSEAKTWELGRGWRWVLGTALVISIASAVHDSIPPAPLSDAEQGALAAQGIVWAAPCAPAPAASTTMVLSTPEFRPLGSIDTALQVLGPFRMARLLTAGWRFWRPKTSLDC